MEECTNDGIPRTHEGPHELLVGGGDAIRSALLQFCPIEVQSQIDGDVVGAGSFSVNAQQGSVSRAPGERSDRAARKGSSPAKLLTADVVQLSGNVKDNTVIPRQVLEVKASRRRTSRNSGSSSASATRGPPVSEQRAPTPAPPGERRETPAGVSENPKAPGSALRFHPPPPPTEEGGGGGWGVGGGGGGRQRCPRRPDGRPAPRRRQHLTPFSFRRGGLLRTRESGGLVNAENGTSARAVPMAPSAPPPACDGRPAIPLERKARG